MIKIEKKTKQMFTVRLDKDLIDKIDKLSEKLRENRSRVVEQILLDRIRKELK